MVSMNDRLVKGIVACSFEEFIK